MAHDDNKDEYASRGAPCIKVQKVMKVQAVEMQLLHQIEIQQEKHIQEKKKWDEEQKKEQELRKKMEDGKQKDDKAMQGSIKAKAAVMVYPQRSSCLGNGKMTSQENIFHLVQLCGLDLDIMEIEDKKNKPKQAMQQY